MNEGVAQFVVAGRPDVNGVHALVRLALVLAVLAAIAVKLKTRDE